MHHSEDSYRSHKTHEKDTEGDEDPRPAKRRKAPNTYPRGLTSPMSMAQRPASDGLTAVLTCTTQPEVDESPSQADHTHPPTPVDNDYQIAPQTTRSPSAVESTPIAEYQEWSCQSFLKRTTIGNQTQYNVEFALPRKITSVLPPPQGIH
jgi:hypothetical protein